MPNSVFTNEIFDFEPVVSNCFNSISEQFPPQLRDSLLWKQKYRRLKLHGEGPQLRLIRSELVLIGMSIEGMDL